jgi:2-haloacid dehalogenase
MSEAKPILAFDIYGTLVDPNGMEVHLEPFFGSQAKKACEIWRDKQVEYSFRRALMERYVDFDACTAQALVYVGELLGVALSAANQQSLLARYGSLPAFPDVDSTLPELEARGYNLVAFSNGTENAVRNLLEQAGLLDRFRAVISVDEVKSFKPDPAVYAHLAQGFQSPATSVWLISSNPFDVIGAKSYGLRSAWVRRDQRRIFDPWEFSPDLVVGSLLDLPAALDRCSGSSES